MPSLVGRSSLGVEQDGWECRRQDEACAEAHHGSQGKTYMGQEEGEGRGAEDGPQITTLRP